MQSIEGEIWQEVALQLAHAAWEGADRDTIACILHLGEPDDRPYRSDLRKNYPAELTDEEILESFQRNILSQKSKQLKQFGMGPDMPSQWNRPTPVLDVGSIAQYAGVTSDAVRAACRRGALRSLKLGGYGGGREAYFVRLSDCEAYYGAWDSEKSDRILMEMRRDRNMVVRDGIAFLLPAEAEFEA